MFFILWTIKYIDHYSNTAKLVIPVIVSYGEGAGLDTCLITGYDLRPYRATSTQASNNAPPIEVFSL